MELVQKKYKTLVEANLSNIIVAVRKPNGRFFNILFGRTAYLLKSAILIFMVLLMPLNAQEKYNNFILNNIKFSGNKQFSKKILLEKIPLQETNFIQRKFLQDQIFRYNEELYAASRERLVNFYQREGFLNVTISKKFLKMSHQKKQIKKMVIEIDEGQPIMVGKISYEFEANTSLDSSAKADLIHRIHKTSELDSGRRFRDDDFQQDQSNIRDLLSQEGYAFGKADYDLQLSQKEKKVRIKWQLKTGKLYRFGPSTILGNKNVSKAFIREQLSYEKGDIFRKSDLERSQNNIYDTGLFQVVNVRSKYDRRQNKMIPVEINVKEAPRLNTQIGLGYGTEDEFRTFVELRRINLFGGARRVELTARHSALELYNVNFKYIQPQFFTRKSSLILNPFIRHETEPGYETLRLGWNLPLTYRFTKYIKSSSNFYFERVWQDVAKIDPSEMIRKSSGQYLYSKSGIILDNEWKTSQPMFFPDQGFFLHLSYKINGHLFESNFNYGRLLADFRKYQRFDDIVLATRLKVGGIESADRDGFIPVEDRFYSGGSMSVRGWARSKLGPQSGNNPKGGKSLLESSLELRFPIHKKLSGTIFTDIGNVWRDSYSYNFADLRYAAGFGLRYRIPIGPIRIDIARPINDPKKSIQVHLNIGQAF